MGEGSIIGVDIAKHVFQLHGAHADGSIAFSKKLSRGKLLSFLGLQPRCVVAMEACASLHYRGREIEALGHQVRLIAAAYVKPFVKRQKNDAADAEAIAEVAARPTMRFVAVKSAEKQASGMVFRVRDLRTVPGSKCSFDRFFQRIAAVVVNKSVETMLAPSASARKPRAKNIGRSGNSVKLGGFI